MSDIHLTVAISDYDHVRDFANGVVKADGISPTFLDLQIEEIFHRFTNFREWDVSELSFAKYVSLVSQDDDTLTAIPVFPSRVFRLSSLYVRRDGPVKTARDLAGKKVGVPEWAQTAAVYTRGYLTHQAGIPLAEIDWYQAGVNQPGRKEKVELKLPAGVRYTACPERSLNEMLLAGDLDAAMSARPVEAFSQGHPDVVRLFPDYRHAEEAYFRETAIFPIMHVVAVRKAVLEQYPWAGMNLLKAFEQAKQRSVARALDITAARYPLPWVADTAEQARRLFGDDLWPYGIEANRTTLEAFLAYAFEQGVCHRHLQPEELFPKNVQSSFKV